MNAADIPVISSHVLLCGVLRVTYSQPMKDQVDDSALMLRYGAGDTTAFDKLYSRHKDSLYRYLLRQCTSRDIAEDVYQDVWRKIIDSRARYRATAKFSTFLYRIAHNAIIDHVRRNKRYSTNPTHDADLELCPADQPEVATEKLMFRHRMHRALQQLPEEQRDAFLLHEEASLGLDSIASITGVSRETIKSRLRYANNKLKLALAEPVTQVGSMMSRTSVLPGDQDD